MNPSRRQFLAAAAAATTATIAASHVAASGASAASAAAQPTEFSYCLNTATIRGQELGIEQEVRVTAEAGYNAIEPWIGSLRKFVESGGVLKDLRSLISDSGLTVESAIGFAQWIADDEAARMKGLDEARRDMEMLREIGGTRIAAPPVGAHNDGPKLDLMVVADRYRALLEIGDETGVVPQLEVWGFSRNLSRLGESVAVCVEAGHPKACLLPDVYHIFKGGSDFAGLSLLSDSAIQVFHMNDYPSEPSRQEMNDSHRVFPGDGVAPLADILNMIGGHGRKVVLSLELFNRDYWQRDALEVAKTGLQKMQSAVASIQPANA
ncbi:MAG: sugar phosphate isomerase/epimerase family protein [Planctomycetaceae bacterium]